MSGDFFNRIMHNGNGLQNALQSIDPMRSILPDQTSFLQLVNQNGSMLESAAQAQKYIAQLTGLPSVGELAAQSSLTIANMPDIIRQFEHPGVGALAELHQSLRRTNSLEILGRYNLEADTFRQALDRMNTPWLDIRNQMDSITGLTELHGIGHILANMPNYDDFVTSALRNDLGDWRGPLVFDPAKLVDQTTRTNFYIDRGFDPKLTTFPVEVFGEGLGSAGLYEPNSVSENDETEASFMRTNEAHDRLMRFEFHLRIFLDNEMTKIIGPNWIKHRVPAEMRQTWEEKKKRAASADKQDQPLISYADFTDYLTIIIRKDNWREVFEAFFNRKTSVQESFWRLFPVRICTMHARPITQEDALFLLVEIKRMNKAMGVES